MGIIIIVSHFLYEVNELYRFVWSVKVRPFWVSNEWIIAFASLWTNILILAFWIAKIFSNKNASKNAIFISKVFRRWIPNEIKRLFFVLPLQKV